ncbi:hypothetical protein LZ31DRAFT_198984 [Colletotrichum somersetense]|nr:hypothetical protein LZ31DRAFT_198984 [Colletotrichum somersetense]
MARVHWGGGGLRQQESGELLCALLRGDFEGPLMPLTASTRLDSGGKPGPMWMERRGLQPDSESVVQLFASSWGLACVLCPPMGHSTAFVQGGREAFRHPMAEAAVDNVIRTVAKSRIGPRPRFLGGKAV